MTAHKTVDVGVARQIGAYSDVIEAAPNLRWLYTAGTPGLSLDGKLPYARVSWATRGRRRCC